MARPAEPAPPAGPEAPPPPVLLDVTRLVSRIGRGHPTGIDRVEAAWLGHLLHDPRTRLLCRTRLGQLVLPPATGAAILLALGLEADGRGEGATAPRAGAGRFARLLREARLARAALARWRRRGQGLARALRRGGVPGDAVYLNTGHANLTAAVLAALPLRKAVLIHDTIPLDFPQWTRPGQDAAFRDRLAAACTHADLLLAVSGATAARLEDWRQRLRLPRHAAIMVAPIGTTLARPDPGQPLPPRPYFLTLGTIEPRKNHALLLDAWARLAPPSPPHLVIAGRRGWLNADVFARLDALPPGGPITEAADLADGAVAALMEGAQALLFPSLAEGFGLPLTEAAARGVPILALDLHSTRELLGNQVRYLPDDPAHWAAAVAGLAQSPRPRREPVAVPGWDDHFRRVLGSLAAL